MLLQGLMCPIRPFGLNAGSVVPSSAQSSVENFSVP